MILREAIIKVLQDNHEAIMSADSIASLINEESLFHKPIDASFLLFGARNDLKDFRVLIELRK